MDHLGGEVLVGQLRSIVADDEIAIGSVHRQPPKQEAFEVNFNLGKT
jgi:hypothetical protein